MVDSIISFCEGKTVEKVFAQEDYKYWEIFFSDGTSVGIDSVSSDRKKSSQIALIPSLPERRDVTRH